MITYEIIMKRGAGNIRAYCQDPADAVDIKKALEKYYHGVQVIIQLIDNNLKT